MESDRTRQGSKASPAEDAGGRRSAFVSAASETEAS